MSVPPRRPWPAPVICLGLALILVGCDQPGGSTQAKAKPRPILGERTQDIRDAAKEKQAGGVVASPRIVSKDPITLPGNAYVSIIGQASKGQITHALDLYQADTGEYPKTLEEFMEKIIKANNIALPKLPFYQEYTYDVPTHQLQIMEYPARKEEANYPK